MDLLAGLAFATAVCVAVAVGFVTLQAANAGAQVMLQMFQSPSDLGWPVGVQEDDDHHWQWTGAQSALTEAENAGRAMPSWVAAGARDDQMRWPEIVELPDGAGPLVTPVARR